VDVLKKEMEWSIFNESEIIANEQKWILNGYFKEGHTIHKKIICLIVSG
jgi:hypothetical protein